MRAIPFDILDIIIGLVARANDADKQLKACSLTCKAFLPHTRRHIFSSIDFLGRAVQDIPIEKRDNMTKRFNELLDCTPEITPCVHTLTYQIMASDFTNAEIHRLLQRLTNIKTLLLFPDFELQELPWGTIPGPLLSAILRLMHLPTTTSITVVAFSKFPLSVLETAVQLEDLVMGQTEILLETGVAGSQPPPVPAESPQRAHLLALDFRIKRARGQTDTPAQHPIASVLLAFDLTKLQTFQSLLYSTRDQKAVNSVLKASGDSMKSLVFDMSQSHLHGITFAAVPDLEDLDLQLTAVSEIPGSEAIAAMAPVNPPFDLAAISKLQTLRVDISHWDLVEDLLHVLSESLRNSTKKPSLHLSSVFFRIWMNSEEMYGPCCSSGSWRALDAAFADAKVFPALQNVTLQITIYSATGRNAQNFQDMNDIHGSRYDKFPKLVWSGNVAFEFNTLIWNASRREVESLDSILHQHH